jgi:hypothetical protein
MTANRQPPTANHDEKIYIILGFFSTKVEPLRLSPNTKKYENRGTFPFLFLVWCGVLIITLHLSFFSVKNGHFILL